MKIKNALCLLMVLVLCTSSAMAAGPRGRRMRGPRHRQSRFPVIVDYQSRAGWGGGRSVQWMPSGSATYVNYPPGWRGPIYATVPSVPVPAGTVLAPTYSQPMLPGYAPHYGAPVMPDSGHYGTIEHDSRGAWDQHPSPPSRSRMEIPQIDGSESSPGERSVEGSNEL